MNSNDEVTARQDVQARRLAEARARGVQGSIVRRFDALEEVQVEVLSSDGPSDIRRAAFDAAAMWSQHQTGRRCPSHRRYHEIAAMLLVSFQFSEAAIPIGFHEGGVQSRSRRCSLSAGRAQNSDSTSARGMRLQFSFTKKLSRRSTSAGKERVLPASAATTLARCAIVGATLERPKPHGPSA